MTTNPVRPTQSSPNCTILSMQCPQKTPKPRYLCFPFFSSLQKPRSTMQYRRLIAPMFSPCTINPYAPPKIWTCDRGNPPPKNHASYRDAAKMLLSSLSIGVYGVCCVRNGGYQTVVGGRKTTRVNENSLEHH